MLRKSNSLNSLHHGKSTVEKYTLNFKGEQTAVQNNQIKTFGLHIFRHAKEGGK